MLGPYSGHVLWKTKLGRDGMEVGLAWGVLEAAEEEVEVTLGWGGHFGRCV